MKIAVEDNRDYDTGIHPEVTIIIINRGDLGDFFKENRFPNLEELDCSYNGLMKLELNCPSLQKLWCRFNLLTVLELICPSLKRLDCSHNRLSGLELDCPFLKRIDCSCDHLTDLNGLEFCSELEKLECSWKQRKSAEILKIHLPRLKIKYDVDQMDE